MVLNGEFITHKAFGRGQIVQHEDTCITVQFVESGETKKFIYPSAIGTFLTLNDSQKAMEFQAVCDSLASDMAMARRDEADRQLAERHAAAEYAKKLKKSMKKPTKKVKIDPIEPEEDML